MNSTFEVGFFLSPELLRSPPPQARAAGLTICPFSLRVGSLDFPHVAWTDYAGVLLRLWGQELWRLARGDSRAARLVFFDTPNEVWIRRTRERWWKVSCVERVSGRKVIRAEAACILERMEVAVMSAGRRFLVEMKRLGFWGPDCEDLSSFLKNPHNFMIARSCGSETRSAPSEPAPLVTGSPSAILHRLSPPPSSVAPPRHPDSSPAVPPPTFQQAPPMFCPRCSAVLKMWARPLKRQSCPLCGFDVHWN